MGLYYLMEDTVIVFFLFKTNKEIKGLLFNIDAMEDESNMVDRRSVV